MNNPKITIVTVVFNGEKEIIKTIESVINQTYLNKEYIIIDGGSTDNTLQIAKLYGNQISTIISEPDKGVYDAMNKAIDLATGEWINFMNVGDEFASPTVVSDFFNKANLNPPVDILYGDVIYNYPFGRYYQKCENAHWCHQSVFARTTIMKRFKFDLRFKIMADEYFIKTALDNGSKCAYVPQVLAVYDNVFGLSATNPLRVLKERTIIRNEKKNLSWYVLFVRLQASYYIKKLIGWDSTKHINYDKMKKVLDSNSSLTRLD